VFLREVVRLRAATSVWEELPTVLVEVAHPGDRAVAVTAFQPSLQIARLPIISWYCTLFRAGAETSWKL
jgi:hypothetical protein